MTAKSTTSKLFHNHVFRIALVTAAILLIPLVAMQFTNDVKWDLMDFIVIGTLLFGTGLLYELITKRVHDVKYRIIVGVVLILALLIIWVELAVGIFD